MHITRKVNLGLAALALCITSAAARAELVVIVSSKNPTSTISVEQAADIFLASTSTFPAGTPATPINLAEGASQRDEFYSKVTGKSPAQVKGYWSKLIFTGKGHPPKEGPDSATVKKMVADNPNAIGYIEKSAVDASVKVILTVR
jgi:ABC-type phosphate transport system substrate-binding protein